MKGARGANGIARERTIPDIEAQATEIKLLVA